MFRKYKPRAQTVEEKEIRRVETLKDTAKVGHPKIHESRAKRAYARTVSLGKFKLGWQQVAIGDLVQQKLNSIAASKFYRDQNPGTIHVKDGKPLTAHGAKLLGVPWWPNP